MFRVLSMIGYTVSISMLSTTVFILNLIVLPKCVDSSTSANGGVVLEEVLEEPPKWKVLRVSE